jgi:predicted ribosomally synthesized peptide with SipW-like signal peptide
MKAKTTGRLVASIIAIVMCFAMLLGTTFAWFTDSVNSSNNKIQSGDLKVDLELLDKDTGLWNSIKEDKTALFNYNNWEPGYTEVKVLKVENEGSLALKWKAKFVSDEQLSILADVIDVYVKPSETEIGYPADRSLAGYKKVGTVAEFVNTIEETTYGELAREEVAYLGLALKMQESAGNEYQSKTIGAFDIQIVATQFTVENDTFGSDYDKNLEMMNSGISTALDDGSTVFYYNKESGFEGRVRLTALPENVGSEYVVPAEVNDLGGVLTGVTLDKLTINSDIEYAFKSIEGAHIGEVVIEDGAKTIPNRMFYKTYVDSVVIPDSVTYLEESAFQQAYIDELVIPASVETFGVHAFAGATFKKITFEEPTGWKFKSMYFLNDKEIDFSDSERNAKMLGNIDFDDGVKEFYKK